MNPGGRTQWLRALAALTCAAAALALAGCGGSSSSSEQADAGSVTRDVQPSVNSKKKPRSQAAEAQPPAFAGPFSTMDERQRCKATDNAVVCASTESGQRVRLDRSGASYEGEVATSFPAAEPLGVGNEIETASGIRCSNTYRGIECNRGGHGFVIGDSAVLILRGPDEERFESIVPETIPEPLPPAPTTEEAEPVGPAGPDRTAESGEFCWPAVTIPSRRLPPVHIPETHIPATDIGGVHYPAQTFPPIDYPAQTLPGVTLPGGCFESSPGFSPAETSVRVTGYDALDPEFSDELSTAYWDSAPASLDVLQPGFSAASVPDVTAAGYGELNEAGFPKNQYVRSYVRRDGTVVDAHWRNSPSDGLPTCQVISC